MADKNGWNAKSMRQSLQVGQDFVFRTRIQSRERFIRLESLAMRIESSKKNAAVGLYRQRAQLLNNPDEYWGLGAWGTSRFGRAIAAAASGGKPFPVLENERTLRDVMQAQQRERLTTIDWDPRLPFEFGGKEDLPPHLLRWLKRVKPYIYK